MGRRKTCLPGGHRCVLLIAALLCGQLSLSFPAAGRADPLVASGFRLEVEGRPAIDFTSVRMIGSESEVITEEIVNPDTGETLIRQTPGPLTWLDVVLTRPLVPGAGGWTWRQQVVDGDADAARANCAVVVLGQANEEIARWEFLNAWPTRVVLLDIGTNGTVQTVGEQLTFAHEGCVRGTLTVGNRHPRIFLPGPHTVPLLGATNFQVTVSDPDGDMATLVQMLAPSGASFDGTNFTWTATLAHHDTVQTIRFRADDQRATSNSVVDAETTITVPYDFDVDGLGDGWEVVNFSNLTHSGIGDYDHDGASNTDEQWARTDPNDPFSRFAFMSCSPGPGTSNVALRFSTESGLTYTIEFTDDLLTASPPSWQPFADPGRGTWTETSPSSTVHVIVDDFGPATSVTPPATGERYYRVKVTAP